MRKVLLLIYLFVYINGIGQQPKMSNLLQRIELNVGTKIKVTPIYLKQQYDFIFFYLQNIQEQPGMYLSGVGSFFLEQKVRLSNKFGLLLHQSLRRDFLVDHIRFNLNEPYEGEGTEKRFIYDFFAFLQYGLHSNKEAKFYLEAGGGVSGINTGHLVVQRVYFTDTTYNERSFRNNFIYPVVHLGIRWERKKVGAGLLIGYCWKNPTLQKDASFLLPEISLYYKLFKYKNED